MPRRKKSQIPNPKSQTNPKSKIRRKLKIVAAELALPKKRRGRPRKIVEVPKTEEIQVEESKYYAGPVIQKFEEARPFVFPAGYGDNRIVAMVRDPYWIYVYWEISDFRRQQIISEIGEACFSHSKEYLRVYDTDNWDFFDLEVTGGAKNWYIKIPTPHRTYCVDIGYLTSEGKFITASRSNWVTTPLDRMSEVIDEQWMIPEWEKMYSLSGGFGVGKGSEEIRELIKRQLPEQAASGWLFSLASPVRKIKEEPNS